MSVSDTAPSACERGVYVCGNYACVCVVSLSVLVFTPRAPAPRVHRVERFRFSRETRLREIPRASERTGSLLFLKLQISLVRTYFTVPQLSLDQISKTVCLLLLICSLCCTWHQKGLQTLLKFLVKFLVSSW